MEKCDALYWSRSATGKKVVYAVDDHKIEEVKSAMLEWDKDLFEHALSINKKKRL